MSITEKTLTYLSTLAIAILLVISPARAVVHHELHVKLIPSEHRIEAMDKVTLPATSSELGMNLGLNLAPMVIPVGDGVTKELIAAPGLVVLKRETPGVEFALSYSGVIDFPLTQVGEEYARGQKETMGSIGPDGVYLDGGSGWYPSIPDESFFMTNGALPAQR